MLEDIFMQNPIFKGMDPLKLQFIMNFANQEKPASMQQAMPFLMANMSKAKQQNINFTGAEVKLIADILCKDLPDTEKEKVNKIMKMLGN